MRVTVFTPSYNRGYIIENLYRSLQRQSFTDFEWVVIDDGSTDNTEELFKKWTEEDNFFKIRYKRVNNGGKHRAVNCGVRLARGELFFIVDSDDCLPDNSIEIIDRVEKTIPENDKMKFCGVCGLCGCLNESNKIVGSTFFGDAYLDITSLEREKNHITGDKSEVFYTRLLKDYPFPEIDGEKFLTEAVVWDRIAFDGYKMRYFNIITYLCDYLDDGLTAAGYGLYSDNPAGWGFYIRQSTDFGKLHGIEKWNEYLRFYYNTRNKLKFCEIAGCLNKSPIKFWIELFGVRLFYKLYDRE